MGDFFHSWRRRFGVLTLVMACVLFAAWLKSIHNADFVIFNGVWPNHAVLSGFGRFRIFKLGKYTFSSDEADVGTKITYTFHEWAPLFASHNWSPVFVFGSLEHKIWPFEVFEVYDDSTGTRYPMWMVPYWSLVLPLTLISAYLLLSKPRKAQRSAASLPSRGGE